MCPGTVFWQTESLRTSVSSYWCQGQPIGPIFKGQAVKYCLGPLRLSIHKEEEEEEEINKERNARDMQVKVVKIREV